MSDASADPSPARFGPLGGALALGKKILWGDVRQPSHNLTAGLFLRMAGLIYFCAFGSLWLQVDGLFGEHGILPVSNTVELMREYGRQQGWSDARLFAQFPTLCLWKPSADCLRFLCAAGALLGLALGLGGLAPLPILALLWLGYLSVLHAGQEFLGYQWDALLVETGLLALFLAPIRWRSRLGSDPEPSWAILWLCRWLAFRLNFSSGFGKFFYGNDPWRDGTALMRHYETQPLPTWWGWAVHQLPEGFHRFSVESLFFIQVIAPFLIFAPRRMRFVGGWILVLSQIHILLTGNYCFFNLLTLAVCLTLWDDPALRAFGRGLKRLWPRRLANAIGRRVRARWDGWRGRVHGWMVAVKESPQGRKLREAIEGFRSARAPEETEAPADLPSPVEAALASEEKAPKPEPPAEPSFAATPPAKRVVAAEQLDFLSWAPEPEAPAEASPESPAAEPEPPVETPSESAPAEPESSPEDSAEEPAPVLTSPEPPVETEQPPHPAREIAEWTGGTLWMAARAFLVVAVLALSGSRMIQVVYRRNPPPVLQSFLENKTVEGLSKWAGPFCIVNNYGLFVSMTMQRPEIIVEGSYDGETWRPYEFKWKPGHPARRPGFVAPHQPRLDWQMWFASLSPWPPDTRAWINRFFLRLLEGSDDVTALLYYNPFRSEPPRYIRATLYEYRFASPSTLWNRGEWWVRRELRPYSPVLTLDRRGRLEVYSGMRRSLPSLPIGP